MDKKIGANNLNITQEGDNFPWVGKGWGVRSCGDIEGKHGNAIGWG